MTNQRKEEGTESITAWIPISKGKTFRAIAKRAGLDGAKLLERLIDQEIQREASRSAHRLWIKRPFMPFRLRTSDGHIHDVGDPEQFWITDVLVGIKDGYEALVISPENIVSAEVIKREPKNSTKR